MENYEITTLNAGVNYTEYIKANSILNAIDLFYNYFGYQKIIKVEITDII